MSGRKKPTRTSITHTPTSILLKMKHDPEAYHNRKHSPGKYSKVFSCSNTTICTSKQHTSISATLWLLCNYLHKTTYTTLEQVWREYRICTGGNFFTSDLKMGGAKCWNSMFRILFTTGAGNEFTNDPLTAPINDDWATASNVSSHVTSSCFLQTFHSEYISSSTQQDHFQAMRDNIHF